MLSFTEFVLQESTQAAFGVTCVDSNGNKTFVTRVGQRMWAKTSKGVDVSLSNVGISPEVVTKALKAKTAKQFAKVLSDTSEYKYKFEVDPLYEPPVVAASDENSRIQVTFNDGSNKRHLIKVGSIITYRTDKGIKLSIKDLFMFSTSDFDAMKKAKTDKEFLKIVKSKISSAKLV